MIEAAPDDLYLVLSDGNLRRLEMTLEQAQADWPPHVKVVKRQEIPTERKE